MLVYYLIPYLYIEIPFCIIIVLLLLLVRISQSSNFSLKIHTQDCKFTLNIKFVEIIFNLCIFALSRVVQNN